MTLSCPVGYPKPGMCSNLMTCGCGAAKERDGTLKQGKTAGNGRDRKGNEEKRSDEALPLLVVDGTRSTAVGHAP